MNQADRDRLVALKKAKKKLITQKQAAEELGITERHVRRLLRELKRRGDKVVAHGLDKQSSCGSKSGTAAAPSGSLPPTAVLAWPTEGHAHQHLRGSSGNPCMSY